MTGVKNQNAYYAMVEKLNGHIIETPDETKFAIVVFDINNLKEKHLCHWGNLSRCILKNQLYTTTWERCQKLHNDYALSCSVPQNTNFKSSTDDEGFKIIFFKSWCFLKPKDSINSSYIKV